MLTDKIVKIECIYGPGYGSIILLNIEHHFRRKRCEKIISNCSIDPIELKVTVIRRLNFYIKNNYRVYDTEFRKKYVLYLK